MAKGNRIPEETSKKQVFNLLSETIYMVVYHSKQSHDARRKNREVNVDQERRKAFHSTYFFLYFPVTSWKKIKEHSLGQSKTEDTKTASK
jgi:hypothetical protein